MGHLEDYVGDGTVDIIRRRIWREYEDERDVRD
jgi:hypothetical protein